jgi:hypothetical protein
VFTKLNKGQIAEFFEMGTRAVQKEHRPVRPWPLLSDQNSLFGNEKSEQKSSLPA